MLFGAQVYGDVQFVVSCFIKANIGIIVYQMKATLTSLNNLDIWSFCSLKFSELWFFLNLYC